MSRQKFLALVVLALAAGALHSQAQQQAASFTLDQVMSYPFPENLVAASSGGRVAWTFNEHGARNIYVADAPQFTPRKVTSYDQDDGQELMKLAFSEDGRRDASRRWMWGRHRSGVALGPQLLALPVAVPRESSPRDLGTTWERLRPNTGENGE
jgi:hypothetical protein